jgi:hypothetical protein
VLAQHGVSEEDLKPAYLMLSGCESDLGRMARAASDHHKKPEISAEHYKNSRRWLQKVFGTQTPTLDLDPPSGGALSDNRVNGHPHCEKTSPPIPPKRTPGPHHPNTPNNEVKSSRDRHSGQANILQTKRKHDDDVTSDRDRRKIGRSSDDPDKAPRSQMKPSGNSRQSETVGKEVHQTPQKTERKAGDGTKRKKIVVDMSTKPLFEDLTRLLRWTGLGGADTFETNGVKWGNQ